MAVRIDPNTLQLKDQVVSINRVTKVVKGGKNLSFSALVVVGDGGGHVGYGAGKSGVTVEGSVKTADGTLLATFAQRRLGVMGGDSMKKLTSDTNDIAEDLAKFLSAWAKGKNLK